MDFLARWLLPCYKTNPINSDLETKELRFACLKWKNIGLICRANKNRDYVATDTATDDIVTNTRANDDVYSISVPTACADFSASTGARAIFAAGSGTAATVRSTDAAAAATVDVAAATATVEAAAGACAGAGAGAGDSGSIDTNRPVALNPEETGDAKRRRVAPAMSAIAEYAARLDGGPDPRDPRDFQAILELGTATGDAVQSSPNADTEVEMLLWSDMLAAMWAELEITPSNWRDETRSIARGIVLVISPVPLD